jgi:DNA polymerase-3 subunit beta
MQIIIDRAALKAVSLFSGVNDTRYYFNGVLIEANTLQTRLVATDGHTMGVHKRDAKDENTGVCKLIMPSDAVASLLKIKPASKALNDITLTVPDDIAAKPDQEMRAEFSGQIVIFKAIDGLFPDYRRVIPSKLSGEAAQFNAAYLYRCAKAAECFGNKDGHFGIGYNGQGAALARITSEMVAVIMPISNKVLPAAIAEDGAWARESLPELPVAPVVAEPIAEAA